MDSGTNPHSCLKYRTVPSAASCTILPSCPPASGRYLFGGPTGAPRKLQAGDAMVESAHLMIDHVGGQADGRSSRVPEYLYRRRVSVS
jgi:hypothetical protein